MQTQNSITRCGMPLTQMLSVAIALSSALCAQEQKPPADLTLDKTYVRRVVSGCIKTVSENYVFRDQAADVTRVMTGRMNAGEYDTITSALALVPRINKDMRDVAHDAHLRLGYSFEPHAVAEDEDSPAELEKDRRAAYESGFGLKAVERLPGDIGYLKVDHLLLPDVSGDQIGMAFKMLASTRALILDLRDNEGGDIDAVPMFVSYFLPPKPALLGELFSGPENRIRQEWSLAYLPGPRYLGRPVYVLISAQTFSGGEAVAYHLKRLGATLVGETTRGGAHPSRWYIIDPHFAVSVPVLRPLGGSSWEGTGITPTVAVSAGAALEEAKKLALAKLDEHRSHTSTPEKP